MSEIISVEKQEMLRQARERADQLYARFVNTLKNSDDSVAEFINGQVNLNRLTPDGMAPILYASGIQVDEMLGIEGNSANVKVVDENGHNPAVRALLQQNTDTLERLLRFKDDDFRECDSHNKDLVDYALEVNNPMAVRLLNKHGFDFNRADENGLVPAMRAARDNQAEVFVELMRNPHLEIDVKDNNGKSLTDYVLDSPSMEIWAAYAAKVDERGRSPLLLAVQNNDMETFGALMATGLSNLDAADKQSGETALLAALKNKNYEMAQQLIDAGADINVQDKQGNTPLSYAIMDGNKELFDRLIKDKRIDINKGCYGAEKLPPLGLALEQKQMAFAAELMQHGADINGTYDFGAKHGMMGFHSSLVFRSAMYGDVEGFKILANAGAKLAISADKMFHEHYDVYAAMLKVVESNAENTPMSLNRQKIACQLLENPQPVEMFIGEDPTSHKSINKRMTFWEYAVVKGKEDELVNFVLKHDVDLNLRNQETGQTLFMSLAHKADYGLDDAYNAFRDAAIKKYADAPEKISAMYDTRDAEGFNMLHQASRFYGSNVFLDAVKYTKDVDALTPEGETALHILLKNEKGMPALTEECLQALLDAKTDITKADKFGLTPLHRAATMTQNPDKIAEMLLESQDGPKINVDAQDKFGRTPLFVAMEREPRYEIARTLLEYKADPNLATDNGIVPLEVAIKRGDAKTAQLLHQFGAQPDKVKDLIEKAIDGAKFSHNPEILKFALTLKPELSKQEKQQIAKYIKQYNQGLALKKILSEDKTKAIGYELVQKKALEQSIQQSESTKVTEQSDDNSPTKEVPLMAQNKAKRVILPQEEQYKTIDEKQGKVIIRSRPGGKRVGRTG